MKKILVFLAASVLMIGSAYAEIAWDGQTATAWTQGDGSASSPYIIATPSNLAYLAQQVRTGNSYTGKFFEQTEDFNLNYGWRSIGGIDADYPTAAAFEGIYNGGNHSIYNLDNSSLFGLIKDATIQNLIIQYEGTAGSLATMVDETNGDCTISNCRNFANISSKNSVGGLVTTAKGSSLTLTWCDNYGYVSSSPSEDGSSALLCVGGLVGMSYVSTLTLTSCHNGADCSCGSYDATASSDISTIAGGLVGAVMEGSSVSINKCSSEGNITGNIVEQGDECGVGHFIGLVSDTVACTIQRSYAKKGLAYNYLIGQCSSKAVLKGCYVIDETNYESSIFKPKATAISCYYVNKFTENWGWYDFSWSTTSSYCFHYGGADISKGTFVPKAEMQSEAFLPRINIDEEYFVMDYNNSNDGYPVLKWQGGTRYAITATCDATRGTVKGGGEYPEGYTATLTATPKSGCSFIGWSDGNTDNPRTVTVSGDAAYIAQFTKSIYTIYVNQDCSSYIE